MSLWVRFSISFYILNFLELNLSNFSWKGVKFFFLIKEFILWNMGLILQRQVLKILKYSKALLTVLLQHILEHSRLGLRNSLTGNCLGHFTCNFLSLKPNSALFFLFCYYFLNKLILHANTVPSPSHPSPPPSPHLSPPWTCTLFHLDTGLWSCLKWCYWLSSDHVMINRYYTLDASFNVLVQTMSDWRHKQQEKHSHIWYWFLFQPH